MLQVVIKGHDGIAWTGFFDADIWDLHDGWCQPIQVLDYGI